MRCLQTAWDRAIRYIPNGTQTLSKRPETYVNGVYPKLLVSGHGCQVVDEAEREYIDYISSLGAIAIGYADISIDDAVKEAINAGEVLLSMPNPREGQLAEKMANLIPTLDKVKFFKTGSEATSCAVRLARAFTGRTMVLKCGYNGWHDWAMARSQRNSGIPSCLEKCIDEFKYNDFDSFKSAFIRSTPVAAVIMEPVVYDEPKDNFLEIVCNFARKNGTLVIFDEIINGLRFGMSGSERLFSPVPDMACYGKCLGNGYAISALLGSAKVMSIFDHEDFIASGTFSGDLVGIAAAEMVLERIRPQEIWANGLILKNGFNLLCKRIGLEAFCQGYPPRTKFVFPSSGLRALFWQECVKRGILFGHTNFPTMAHGPRIIEHTLNVCKDALKIVKENWKHPELKLEGMPPVETLRSN